MNVIEYCASEVERQEGTPMEVYGMYRAYKYLCRRSFVHLTEKSLIAMAQHIKLYEVGEYRTMPAVFNQGPPAMAPQHVPQAMTALIEAQPLMTAHQFCYEFLEIHPFADGNGRVASLAFNFLSGTLQCPVPLPPWSDLKVLGKFTYNIYN